MSKSDQKIIQVTTQPFGMCGKEPRIVLERTKWNIRYNPFDRRIKPHEVLDVVRDAEGIVAGTEPYTPEILDEVKNLKVISRVGVGLDNIPFDYCRERGIAVTFTPEAPADAVAELTVAQILNLLRHVLESDQSVRGGAWNRYLGHLIRERKIGILGVGRIGKRVIKLLQPFCPQIFGCDLKPDVDFGKKYNVQWLEKDEFFKTCELVTVHVPLNERNISLVGYDQLQSMPTGGFLVNIARGNIVDEQALYESLDWKHLAGAALDVFSSEPYDGPLLKFPNVVFTAHMGASAHEGRFQMELGAAEDCVRVLTGESPINDAVKYHEENQ